MKITKRQLRRIIQEYGPRHRGNPTRGMSPEEVTAYNIGYEAGTRGDRSSMPEGPFYEVWTLGFDDGLAVFHGAPAEYM